MVDHELLRIASALRDAGKVRASVWQQDLMNAAFPMMPLPIIEPGNAEADGAINLIVFKYAGGLTPFGIPFIS